MTYNQVVANFDKWIRGKYESWNVENGGDNTLADFAHFLGVPPTSLSNWINAGYKPRSDNLVLISEKYPDVYGAVGIQGHQEGLSFDSVPPALRSLLESALAEIASTLSAGNISINSPEAEKIAAEILARHGFTINTKDNPG